jgi:hypothetical protein
MKLFFAISNASFADRRPAKEAKAINMNKKINPFLIKYQSKNLKHIIKNNSAFLK